MKNLLKKIISIVKPLFKGWTEQGMASYLESQGWTVYKK